MEPNQINTLKEKGTDQLFKATPLSKYLALALFVLLPFIGGYVGYVWAPEKVVEVGIRENVVDEKVLPELNYNEFVPVNSHDYPIDNDIFIASFPLMTEYQDSIFQAVEAKRISEELLLVIVDDGYASESWDGVVLYNDKTNQTIKRVEYEFLTLEKWIQPGVRVTVQGDQVDRIVLTDYIRDLEFILYEESDSTIQLAEECAVTCSGILHKTIDGHIVFGRHQTFDGTSATRLVELISIPLPEEYQPDWSDEWWLPTL